MKPRSRRSWIFGSLALLFMLGCVGLLIWAIHQFGWDWTGFNGGYSKITIHGVSQDKELLQAKTLWDWLQLLIVPAILAAGAGFFTWWSARTERQIAQRRYDQEQKIADQRYQQDRELALEKQREDLLQAYLDRMAELLLEKGLRDSKDDDEVRKVARTRTVSTLIQLDGRRARTIFVFLREAQLTEESNPIISFEDADLSSAKWSEANLSRVDLSMADLSMADLRGADLFMADLRGADLFMAGLRGAGLRGADLRGADLSKADLSKADLSKADLSKADLGNVRYLEDANLDKTILRGVTGLTPEQIARCKARGAIVDEEVTPSASPSQSAAIISSQEAILRASPSSGQAAPSTDVQEATLETATSQEHSTVEKKATPSGLSSQDHATSLSSSQEDTSPVPLLQENATPSSPSQDAAP